MSNANTYPLEASQTWKKLHMKLIWLHWVELSKFKFSFKRESSSHQVIILFLVCKACKNSSSTCLQMALFCTMYPSFCQVTCCQPIEGLIVNFGMYFLTCTCQRKVHYCFILTPVFLHIVFMY